MSFAEPLPDGQLICTQIAEKKPVVEAALVKTQAPKEKIMEVSVGINQIHHVYAYM